MSEIKKKKNVRVERRTRKFSKEKVRDFFSEPKFGTVRSSYGNLTDRTRKRNFFHITLLSSHCTFIIIHNPHTHKNKI